jgi:hypothetical protein
VKEGWAKRLRGLKSLTKTAIDGKAAKNKPKKRA